MSPEVLLPGVLFGLIFGTPNGIGRYILAVMLGSYIAYQWRNVAVVRGRFLRTRRYFVPFFFKYLDLASVSGFELVESRSAQWSPRGCYGVRVVLNDGTRISVYESTSYKRSSAIRWLASLMALLESRDWSAN
jgi:hypothetical protein